MPWSAGHSARLGQSGWQRQRDNTRILRRDGYRCQLALPGVCIGTATEVDHNTNLAAGGSDNPANKRAACHPCHAMKTKRETAAGRAARSRLRPAETHPGAA